MSKIKRLFFDIETSPNIGLFWTSGYKQSISYDSIIKERSIICISYKWAGEKEVHALTWNLKQNDKKLLEDFIKIANKADELVGHNGDAYDLPWIRTRCLFHRIPIFPAYITLDTLKNARSGFRFNSNKLDYIAKFLGVGKKIHVEYDLWKKVLLENNRNSLTRMVEYCKEDVITLEKVYNEMSPYIPSKTHHGVLNGYDRASCPECSSENMTYTKTRVTILGTPRVQLRCDDCGKYHTVSKKVYKNYLENK